jgi:hypothetical protein
MRPPDPAQALTAVAQISLAISDAAPPASDDTVWFIDSGLSGRIQAAIQGQPGYVTLLSTRMRRNKATWHFRS